MVSVILASGLQNSQWLVLNQRDYCFYQHVNLWIPVYADLTRHWPPLILELPRITTHDKPFKDAKRALGFITEQVGEWANNSTMHLSLLLSLFIITELRCEAKSRLPVRCHNIDLREVRLHGIRGSRIPRGIRMRIAAEEASTEFGFSSAERGPIMGFGVH